MLLIRKADALALQTYKRLSMTRNVSACHLMQLFKDSLTNKQWSLFIYMNGTQFALLLWTENWNQLSDFCWPSCIGFLISCLWHWKWLRIVFGALKVCWTIIFVNPYKYGTSSHKVRGSLLLSHKHYSY
jgi:hypothetical protein